MASAQRGTKEARRTPRRVFAHPVGVLYRGSYRLLQAVQLSEGGMMFKADQKMKQGHHLLVTLILPGGSNVVARGEILYERTLSGALNYGVKFVQLPLNLRRLIRNYVTAKTQQEAEMENEGSDEA